MRYIVYVLYVLMLIIHLLRKQAGLYRKGATF
nr:MAG TPA: hypothetical protein [Caudoviricetes sp.]